MNRWTTIINNEEHEVDCNNCKHISLTEEEQTDKKEHHICLKYKIRIFHNIVSQYRGRHTKRLYPCLRCREDKCINYK